MSKQTMKIQDAAKTLGLSGAITPKIVKAARNKMAAQYHPDVAGKAGETMMKLINLAFEALKDFEGEINVAEDQSDYAAEVMERVEAIIHIPEIRVELVGAWIWIHGTQKSSVSARSKEINTAIKAAGFKYHFQKAMWYTMPKSDFKRFRGKKCASHSEIQEKYGSETLKKKSRRSLKKAG